MEGPYCEKLVWQGEFEGCRVRARIVQADEGSSIETVIEKHGLDILGIERWFDYDSWSIPSKLLSYFVEGMIDLLGRPAWDTRKPTSSVYPHKVTVVE